MVTLNVTPNGEKRIISVLLFCLILALVVFITLQCVVISYIILQEIKMT